MRSIAVFAEEDFKVRQGDVKDFQHAAGGVSDRISGEVDFGQQIRVELQSRSESITNVAERVMSSLGDKVRMIHQVIETCRCRGREAAGRQVNTSVSMW